MATVQIRNVPEAVYRIYRARAAAAGMSLQEYLRTELIRNAQLRAPSELVAEVAVRIATEGVDGFARVSAVNTIRADRESH